MLDPTTYSRIVLKFVSPYARDDTTAKKWSLKFNLSGESLTSQSDADATAAALAEPVLGLVSPNTSWIAYLYYGTGESVNSYQGEYAVGAHPGTAAAYPSPSSGHNTQLEVCALIRGYVGVNSKGRSKYVFKHIHDIYEANDAVGTLLADNDNHIGTWATGVGPHDLVWVDPTTGVAATGLESQTALYTRQLRRGQKSPS